MNDLDKKILDLKAESKSLRKIATEVGLTHVAIYKRLKAIEKTKKMVMNEENEGLPLVNEEKRNVANRSNPFKSRVYEESDGIVNQAVTEQTPSPDRREEVNLTGKPFIALPDRFISLPDGLCEAIKEFLEERGIEVYPMEVRSEAYQVKHGAQAIRFYVQRKQGEASQK